MSNAADRNDLAGRTVLVTGVANDASIAWGCARSFHRLGARLVLTVRDQRDLEVVAPLAQQIDARCLLMDVAVPGQMDAVFASLAEAPGRLHAVVHSIAFAPRADLHGAVLDCSRHGFLKAMDLSCYSFIEMARLAAPLMPEGGTLVAMSYLGAHRVVEHYGVMGPVKAALEATVRYLAAELGPRRIRVHAVSPGPIATRAASGIDHFDALMQHASSHAPARALATIDDVGFTTAMLAQDGARMLTGTTTYVDGGEHIVA